MKILLIVIYASFNPVHDQPRVRFDTYEFEAISTFHEAARKMVERVRTGQLRAFCLKVKG